MAERDLLDDYIDVYLSGFKYISELVSVPTMTYHLSFEQFLIMRDVAAGQRLSLSEVAKHRHVTRAAISRQLKSLLDAGYIVQTPDPKDRRRQYLDLTDSGKQVTVEINQAIHKRFYGWVEVIGEKDAKELLRIMRRVSDEVIKNDRSND